eukprot:scaffold148_cov144-Isochrysis_galbana.AAC.12
MFSPHKGPRLGGTLSLDLGTAGEVGWAERLGGSDHAVTDARHDHKVLVHTHTVLVKEVPACLE